MAKAHLDRIDRQLPDCLKDDATLSLREIAEKGQRLSSYLPAPHSAFSSTEHPY